ncbi:MAG: hypothetical protein Q9222_000911 [Ikaeria aurantiellina]
MVEKMEDSIEMVKQSSLPIPADNDKHEPTLPDAPLSEMEPRSRIRIYAILLALDLCLFIAALDTTIVATAIPTISSDLNTASGYLWIGGAYMLANAGASPVWAKLSDIWGRKPILLTAVAIFAAASIVCALADSITMLVVGRACQGTAAGALFQLVNIVISDMFSMRQRSLYLGFLEFIWALAAGIGPILGGVLTQLVSWRWIFWINLPFSGLAFTLILVFLNVHNPKTKFMEGVKAIDWFGSTSIIGLTVMLLLGLNFGGTTFPWDSPKVVCLIVFGCLMSGFFVFSEKRLARFPLMPLGMLKQRSTLMSLLVNFVHGFVFVAGEYYLPLYFQACQSASPIRSGVLTLPFLLSETATGIAAGFLIHRTGRYLELMYIGTLLMTLGFGLFIHFDATSPLAQIVAFQIVAGLGSGLLFEPPLIALQAHVSQADTATATSMFGFSLNLATSISVVVGGVIFQNGMQSHGAPMLRAANVSQDIVQHFSGAEAAANVLIISTIADEGQKAVVKEAFAWSLRNMWILYTVVGGVGVVASGFIGKKELSKEHVETRTGLDVLRKEREGEGK